MIDHLSIYAIYDRPADFPGKVVVRRWEISSASENPQPMEAHVFHTLEDARSSLPPGVVKMDTLPQDDPAILETWL
ncbi:hypothetical protein KW797_01400 [Candidatus Parcubacteria bacterium]|nr:hypothetical protein [Candidatus Parcubacteria bacterium]